jgi:hypothetical protein
VVAVACCGASMMSELPDLQKISQVSEEGGGWNRIKASNQIQSI